MPSALGDSSSRNWWSLGSKSSNQPDDDQEKSRLRTTLKSSGISFNSIASAIGLKNKKQRPCLALQDPPPPLLPSPPSTTTTTPTFTIKPTSPSRSRVDSIGPPTPVDSQRDECQSLLTLSDTDPFAGRPLIIQPVPQIPSKRTPLSVDTSVVHRISCASASSLSTHHTCDTSALSPTVGLTESRKLFNKRSISNLQFPRSNGTKRPATSSTTVADGRTHFTLPRPKLRARGMTDGGGTQKAGFFSDDRPGSKKVSQKSSTSTLSPAISSTEPTSPRVVIRQASLSRIFAPPCTPPMQSLPATPHSTSLMQKPGQYPRTQSISSSCISFVSSSSNEMLPALSYPSQETRSEFCVFSQDHDPEISSRPTNRESKTVPNSPRILKKPLSYQSLTGKSNIDVPTPPKLSPDNMMDKVFRKQRNIHHTRSPMPPIPDPFGQPSSPNSTTFPSLTDFGPKTATERRTSGNSCPGRKRLFSHSGPTRSSTSHCTTESATMEDDSQSVFSLRSDRSSHPIPFKLWTSPKATPPSLWEEPGSPVPSSPTRSTSEYMPLPILSAAEVAKLEASIEDSSDRVTRRTRVFSHLSASTMTSDREGLDLTPIGLSPPPVARPRSKQGSMTTKAPAAKTPAFYSPVSTRAWSHPSPPNNENLENGSGSTIPHQPSPPESPTLTTSLPPPPRPRPRSQHVSRPKLSNTASSNSSSVAKPSRSKSNVDKNTHRQSIMRKPSFLEIDDDTDQDVDLFYDESLTESFLDLARESFEINHSDDP